MNRRDANCEARRSNIGRRGGKWVRVLVGNREVGEGAVGGYLPRRRAFSFGSVLQQLQCIQLTIVALFLFCCLVHSSSSVHTTFNCDDQAFTTLCRWSPARLVSFCVSWSAAALFGFPSSSRRFSNWNANTFAFSTAAGWLAECFQHFMVFFKFSILPLALIYKAEIDFFSILYLLN